MLTEKQRELLLLVHSRLQESGVPPSFDEMRQALHLRSKSGVHRLIRALEERGFIRRLPRRARALEILKLPSASVRGTSARERSASAPLVLVEGGLEDEQQDVEAPPPSADEHFTILPVMGRIAAGTPVEAIQVRLSEIPVPQHLMRSGEHFALEVRGDSMTGAGILDGDTAVIQKTSSVMSGDIVVAIIDGEEATLKRLRRRGNSIALEAANPEYKTRIVRPEQLEVQGKLTGLLRAY